ncbi:MAG: Rrf2 family transcriptional regulator [Verrucomicrobia bacterium]|nr:Rrf2 family transcriptional regulator [Verrucomicrobiota bacterium]
MLSRTSIHAILALKELAAQPPGAHLGAAEIARKIGAPANFLCKLLQSLTPHGLVASQKGRGGGFRLGRPASRITLHRVVKSLEDIERWKGCLLGYGKCSASAPCAAHEKWSVIRDQYLKLLGETTIASLVRDGGLGPLPKR